MADIEEWKGGDLCCCWCAQEEGSTSADACLSLILPCYTYAMIQKKGNKSSCFAGDFILYAVVDFLGFSSCLVCVTRAHINGHESQCRNCMTSCFCSPCALVQAYKTIEGRDSDGNFVANSNPRAVHDKDSASSQNDDQEDPLMSNSMDN